jgi:hypothetical protein
MIKMTTHDRLQYAFAITALVFSALALFVAILELRAARDQFNADVWPYLQLSVDANNSGAAVTLSNRGLGPGIIRSARLVNADGSVVVNLDAPSREQWAQFLDDESGVSVSGTWTVGRAISPGEDVQITRLMANEEAIDSGDIEGLMTARDVLEIFISHPIEICFCSITQDCWIERSDSLAGPQPVDHCPIPEE